MERDQIPCRQHVDVFAKWCCPSARVDNGHVPSAVGMFPPLPLPSRGLRQEVVYRYCALAALQDEVGTEDVIGAFCVAGNPESNQR